MSSVKDYIRKRIRQARREAKLSQEALASRMNSTQSTVSGLERGRVDISAVDLARLAEEVGKPVTFFFPDGPTDLSKQEQELVTMLRQFPPDTTAGLLTSVRGLYNLFKEAQDIQRMPEEDQESAALQAYARMLHAQGLRAHIDEAGYPVLEGEDISAILETEDESEQKALARAIYQLQQLQQ